MIYILGGKGFVGSAYACVCKARGIEHLVVDRDNYSRLAGTHCRVLINVAGNSKKFLARHSPMADFDASVLAVRKSLIDFKYDTFVFISSSDVYPDPSSPGSTAESQALNPARMTPYGFHKHIAELCVQHVAPNWIIARCGGFVGPLMKKNPVFDVLNGGPLWISQESELQYIHTEQAAAIVLNWIGQGVKNEIINLCGRGVVQLKQVMVWARKNAVAQPGSPCVRCELDLSKAAALSDLPESATVVRDFVLACQQDGGVVA